MKPPPIRMALGLTIIAFSCGAQSAPQGGAALKPFEFRGIVAGEPLDSTKIGCRIPGKDDYCLALDKEVAGVPADISVRRSQGTLATLSISFQSSDVRKVLAAFREKYGEPCRTEKESWQNRLGARGEQTVVYWCFSTGELSLKAYGRSLSYGSAFYLDRSYKPKPEAKVDF